MAGVAVHWAKLLLGTQASQIHLPIQLPTDAQPGRQSVTDQELGFLPPVWQDPHGIPDSWFSPGSALTAVSIWGVTQRETLFIECLLH